MLLRSAWSAQRRFIGTQPGVKKLASNAWYLFVVIGVYSSGSLSVHGTLFSRELVDGRAVLSLPDLAQETGVSLLLGSFDNVRGRISLLNFRRLLASRLSPIRFDAC